ncbi:iron-sulfur cluster repair di-iron protein [Haemophilus quentini]|uniref:Iron-sulfur cluster repair di-iron protein n=1 Tax=Haemophilus quentini TaxID=123834 RepID=A0ABX3BQG0_9PAST|nr:MULTISPECIES: iron-sulfur cluster repair protein YtfE [Haemophilus]EGT80834.1 putative hemerythrin HHE cation-binding domain-containing protein [Haemophilus haemolyticus M21639]NYA46779.1 iron-sulfur cluster repair protein YtfE [Haemophilus haemolyticus]OEY75757.1 iron-sulfur cluster repair di-iron protein [Haemophilus quentini]OEY77656.1 iron-sulfur cluster repair di-iron protein [Haemophilus quentini]ORC38816.1 iron-sulfur cluster repair di-iron protein [Haemophilus quentini]
MSFAQQKLSELAVSIPGATKIFREYDLDFCCGGSVLLEVAAQQKNLNLAEIEKRLTDLQQSKAENNDKDWTSASYAEMIDHIITRFHNRHREQLPELITLAEKVENVHGDRDDCPVGVAAQLEKIYAELSQHLMKEEQILFPMIKMGNYAMVSMPIRVMEMEHDEVGQDVEVIKSLTNNCTPPADACFSWKALYSGINEFIDDLMHHIHLENNILFPRVLNEK